MRATTPHPYVTPAGERTLPWDHPKYVPFRCLVRVVANPLKCVLLVLCPRHTLSANAQKSAGALITTGEHTIARRAITLRSTVVEFVELVGVMFLARTLPDTDTVQIAVRAIGTEGLSSLCSLARLVGRSGCACPTRGLLGIAQTTAGQITPTGRCLSLCVSRLLSETCGYASCAWTLFPRMLAPTRLSHWPLTTSSPTQRAEHTTP